MRAAIFSLAIMATGVLAGGSTPQYKYDPNTAKNCNLWWDNEGLYPCMAIPSFYDITPEQYLAWNPVLNKDTCEPFNLNQSYCVGVCNGACPTTTSTKTTASATSSPPPVVSPPSPLQPGTITAGCTKYHQIVSGDNCLALQKTYGFTLDDFVAWNPDVGGTACTNLWLGYYVCVSHSGGSASATATKTSTTSTATRSAVATPTPTQPKMVAKCYGFTLVTKGSTCQDVAWQYGISTDTLILYNGLKSDCSDLQANAYACIDA